MKGYEFVHEDAMNACINMEYAKKASTTRTINGEFTSAHLLQKIVWPNKLEGQERHSSYQEAWQS